MDERAQKFLAGVLGTDGARAFKKAMEQEARIASAVVPRAILSWLNLAASFAYEGGIPGVENTYLSFRKSEDRGYSGAISIGDEVYSFDRASVFHVAGSMALALGLDGIHMDSAVRDLTLQRLGKSIDTLVKARVAVQELEKKGVKKPEPEGESEESVEETEKTELPGQTHQPTKQLEPQAPEQPAFQTQQPKPQKKAPLKITKAESERKCGMCGRPEFQGDQFTGCLCFRDMAAGVRVQKSETGYSLEFRTQDWDLDAVQALLTVFRGR